MNPKKCDGNDAKHSFAWEMIKDLKRKNKRLFALFLTVLMLWLATIGSFVWHISQYEDEQKNTSYSEENN